MLADTSAKNIYHDHVNPDISGLFGRLPFGEIHMKRHKLSGKASRKNFTRGAVLTHKKNVAPAPMRGGIRL